MILKLHFRAQRTTQSAQNPCWKIKSFISQRFPPVSAQETAIAKAFCNEAGHWVASEALQVMGGMGYSQDSIVEYCFRRTRGWMIAGGSIEILKNRIAEGVFETRFSQRPPKAK